MVLATIKPQQICCILCLFILSSCNYKTQKELAKSVANSIRKDLAYNDYIYKHDMLCEKVLEIASPTSVRDAKDVVPDAVYKWIENPEFNNCSPPQSVKNLESFFELLETHLLNAEEREVIILLQFPWKKPKKEEIDNLTQKFRKLKRKDKIAKIYIFGMSGDASIGKIFDSLPKKVEGDGMDRKTIQNELATLIQKLDTRSSASNPDKTHKKYTIFTLFVPFDDL